MKRRKPKPLLFVLIGIIIAVPLFILLLTNSSPKTVPDEPEQVPASNQTDVSGMSEEEIKTMIEEEEKTDNADNPQMIIGDEFTIELDDNQATGGF